MAMRWCFLLAFTSIWCSAQIPKFVRADFDVPGGDIFGAALSKEGDLFYAQQYLSGDESAGPYEHLVRISSWDTKSKAMLASKSFAEDQQYHTIPCRRTLLGATSGHLYVCSERTTINVLDPKTLVTITTVKSQPGSVIRDFAIDESRDRLYMLKIKTDGSSTLGAWTLSKGDSVNEVALPNDAFAYNALAYRPASNLLALAFARTGGWGEKTDLVFYNGLTLQVVRRLPDLPRLDGLLLLGPKLLGIPGYSGYKKQDCIASIDLRTFSSDKDFCSPKTGVNSSASVINDTYLVAATGINRPKLFSDSIESVSSSLSVWNVDTRKIVETLSIPSGLLQRCRG